MKYVIVELNGSSLVAVPGVVIVMSFVLRDTNVSWNVAVVDVCINVLSYVMFVNTDPKTTKRLKENAFFVTLIFNANLCEAC